MTDSVRKRFAHRVVIVTGASSGLGLVTARAFAHEGAVVALTARNGQRLQQVASELEQQAQQPVLAAACDVSDREQVDDFVRKIVDRLGRIDILVNNAGTGMIAPFEQVRIEDAAALFETNFFGVMNCTQAVLPCMKRQRQGCIVNVSSVAGLRGIPNSSIYCASKAAVIAFSEALRIELREFRILVTLICPSRIRLADTGFFSSAKTYGPVELYELPNMLTPDVVAGALLDAVAKHKRMVIIPFHARLMHTVNKFAPRLVDNYLYSRMPKLQTTRPPQSK